MSLINEGLTAAKVLQHALKRPQVLARQRSESLVQTRRLMRTPCAVQVNAATADENACFRRKLTNLAGCQGFEPFLQQREPTSS